jgi:hypothetical protein
MACGADFREDVNSVRPGARSLDLASRLGLLRSGWRCGGRLLEADAGRAIGPGAAQDPIRLTAQEASSKPEEARIAFAVVEALTHKDTWTAADEEALLALPEVAEIPQKVAAETQWWHEQDKGEGKGPRKKYRWGQPHPPSDPRHVPTPLTDEERLDSLRKQVKEIRSAVVPFGEPLVYSFEDCFAGSALKLPVGLAPVGPKDQVCLLSYGFDLRPDEDEAITRIKPKLTYRAPAGLTYSMIPNTELEERFRAQSNVELGFTGKFGAGVPGVSIAPFVQVAGQANAEAETSLLWRWRYRILKAKVLAYGKQSEFAEWDIARDGLVGQLELQVILRLPRKAKKLTLEVSGSYSVKKKRFKAFKRQRDAVVDPIVVAGKLVPAEQAQ